jgi:hypothetical protein
MTASPNFPVAQPLRATYGGNLDAFVLKLNAAGSALDFATYMGGGGDEEGKSLALDSTGNAYITGYTGSGAFPVANPIRPRSGGWEAFISKIADTGSGSQHFTFLPLVLRSGR